MPRKLPQLITVKSDAVIKMFFDFYVLNEIWFKLVAKDVIYGYKTDTIIPFRRESVLNEAFLEICEKLKFLMVNSLEWSVRRECRHFNIYGPLGTLISRKSLKKLMIKAISHNDQKDIKKIKEQIGWTPKISFENGVSEMLKHIQYWAEAPVWTPESIEQETKPWFDALK